ncbi:MAG: hypothetical protein WC435_04085 [Candidatus Paceibacterota bacterium]
MKNKKLIFSIIVAILAVLAVFAYQKYGKSEPVNPDNGNTSLVSNENEKYKGEIALEADGWKKYTNPYWGIEFRFQDKEDKIIKIESSASGIFLISQDKNPNYGTFVYIYIGKFNNRQYSDLREYIEKSGFGHTQNTIGIPSIEEITNQNDIKIYKVSVLDFLSKNQYVSFAIDYNKNDKNYIGIKNAGSNELGQQLLSSFRFID